MTPPDVATDVGEIRKIADAARRYKDATRCRGVDYLGPPLSDPFNYKRSRCTRPTLPGRRFCKDHLRQETRNDAD